MIQAAPSRRGSAGESWTPLVPGVLVGDGAETIDSSSDGGSGHFREVDAVQDRFVCLSYCESPHL